MTRGTDMPKEEREALFASFVAALPKLIEAKKTLRAKGLTAGRMKCPWCGVKGACVVGIAETNNHLRAHRTACNRSMIE